VSESTSSIVVSVPGVHVIYGNNINYNKELILELAKYIETYTKRKDIFKILLGKKIGGFTALRKLVLH